MLIANRDESYTRPAKAAAFWEGDTQILAGRDLEKGGTWLGINKYGRFAAVTNYRDGLSEKSSARSRGLLVSDYLEQKIPVDAYLQYCLDAAGEHGEFNLVLGDTRRLYFLSSRENEFRQLSEGCFALSNGELDASWPKMRRAREEVGKRVQAGQRIAHKELLDFLFDRQPAPDEDLPDTNIGLELERKLSPVFIAGDNYGTRVSTVVTIDSGHEVLFTERSYNSQAEVDGECSYQFTIMGSED